MWRIWPFSVPCCITADFLSPLRMRRLLLCLLLSVGVVGPGLIPAVAAEIHDACDEGDLPRVISLVSSQKPLVGARDRENKTPLHCAAKKGRLAVVEYLLAQGADPNTRDSSGATPGYLAKGFGHREVVALLQKHGGALDYVRPGAPVSSPPRSVVPPVANRAPTVGATPVPRPVLAPPSTRQLMLIETIKADRPLVEIQALLKTNPQLILETDANRLTPMHWAADLGLVPVAEVLLAQGANVNVATDRGWTPLLHAVHQNRREMVIWLLQQRAEVNVQTSDKVTPLMLAAGFAYDEDLIARLLAAGASVNQQDQMGYTPLLLAAGVPGCVKGAELLLQAGAKVNVQEGFSGFSALHYAAARANLPLVQLLVAKGAGVNLLSLEKETPLTLARYEAAAPVVAFLQKNGAQDAPARALTPAEQSLVAWYRHYLEVLAKGTPDEVRNQEVAQRPTKAEIEKVFLRNAPVAWGVVSKVRADEDIAWASVSKSSETKQQLTDLLRGELKPGAYVKIDPLPPSALVRTALNRKWLSESVPVFSLQTRHRGETHVVGDYCYVNQRWIQLPPLSSIFPELK
jgi:ankyrin repeat protein